MRASPLARLAVAALEVSDEQLALREAGTIARAGQCGVAAATASPSRSSGSAEFAGLGAPPEFRQWWFPGEYQPA